MFRLSARFIVVLYAAVFGVMLLSSYAAGQLVCDGTYPNAAKHCVTPYTPCSGMVQGCPDTASCDVTGQYPEALHLSCRGGGAKTTYCDTKTLGVLCMIIKQCEKSSINNCQDAEACSLSFTDTVGYFDCVPPVGS